jgi:hypothetical protein
VSRSFYTATLSSLLIALFTSLRFVRRTGDDRCAIGTGPGGRSSAAFAGSANKKTLVDSLGRRSAWDRSQSEGDGGVFCSVLVLAPLACGWKLRRREHSLHRRFIHRFHTLRVWLVRLLVRNRPVLSSHLVRLATVNG